MNLDVLRGLMRGEHCLIVAPGPSASYVPQERYVSSWTIGCNRAVSICAPDFAVCVEPPNDRDCWSIIAAASPLFVFSHHEKRHPRVVLINNRDALPDLGLPTPKNDKGAPLYLRFGSSVFYATVAALVLGFERIGLIGVDLDPKPRNYAPAFVDAFNAAFVSLDEIACARGQRIVNLNLESRLVAVEKVTWDTMRRKTP